MPDLPMNRRKKLQFPNLLLCPWTSLFISASYFFITNKNVSFKAD